MRVSGLSTTLALLLALAACESPPTERGAAAAAVEVRVASPRRGDISHVLSVTGRTAAASTLRLASPIAGRITQLSVQAGDAVAAGDVVARVVTSENEAALNGLALVERAGAASAEERGLHERLRHELRGRDVPIAAPFAAVVAARLHHPGELVAVNDVLVELVDPRSLYVLAQVPIEFAESIHAGLAVDVGAPMASAGTVAAALPAAAAALTVPVRVALSAPPRPAVLDVSVPCRITVARHGNALLVPRSALLSSNLGEDGSLMVLDGPVARLRPVRLGLRDDAEVEVTQGLGDHDVVIVAGQYALADGAQVRPRPVEP